MRAIVVDANSEGGLRLDDVPAPEPNSDQVLIDVRHITPAPRLELMLEVDTYAGKSSCSVNVRSRRARPGHRD